MIKTDRIYWRIVPVGFATVFLSSVLLLAYLQLLQQFRGWGGDVSVLGTVSGWLWTSFLATLFVGFIAWLPLQILWNIFTRKLLAKVGIRTASFRVSFYMAAVICLPIAMLVWRRAGAEVILLSSLWAIGTACVAGWLTLFAFRNAPDHFGGGQSQ